MGSVMKVLTGILGILAVIACLSTIGIIGYTVIGGGGSQKNTAGGSQTESGQTTDIIDAPSLAPVPTILPDTAGNSTDQTPADISDDTEKHSPSTVTDHVHDYKETVEKKATCYQAGKLKYTCEICGDVYYVDTPSTGHVAEDNWETVRTATADRDGLRVKKCSYCDEVVAQEVIPYSGSGASATPHVHDYIASQIYLQRRQLLYRINPGYGTYRNRLDSGRSSHRETVRNRAENLHGLWRGTGYQIHSASDAKCLTQCFDRNSNGYTKCHGRDKRIPLGKCSTNGNTNSHLQCGANSHPTRASLHFLCIAGSQLYAAGNPLLCMQLRQHLCRADTN